MLSGDRRERSQSSVEGHLPWHATRPSTLIAERQEHLEGQLRKTEGPRESHGWGGPGVLGVSVTWPGWRGAESKDSLWET